MTRDEELHQAAENYTTSMCNDCSARSYCEEKNKRCVECREQAKFFVDGAKWADEHPNLERLWHDAMEEPVGANWEILCVDVHNGCWVESRVNALFLHNEWYDYTDFEKVQMWAYISDLLPKGGEK